MTGLVDANFEMVQGYMDGFKDDRPEFPDSLSNRGAAYRHGWLNGRDDRVGKSHWHSIAEAEQAAKDAMEKDKLP